MFSLRGDANGDGVAWRQEVGKGEAEWRHFAVVERSKELAEFRRSLSDECAEVCLSSAKAVARLGDNLESMPGGGR